MALSVSRLLRDHYLPCVLSYFEESVFDAHPFLRAVYDTPNNRGAAVRAIYAFAERHGFGVEEAESLLYKNGAVLLPLFLPTDCATYADGRAVADVVLTMYTPLLVGLWTSGVEYAAAAAAAGSNKTTTPQPPPPHAPPIEIHVQKDCDALREVRVRAMDRLLKICHADDDRRPVYAQMKEATAVGIERSGRVY